MCRIIKILRYFSESIIAKHLVYLATPLISIFLFLAVMLLVSSSCFYCTQCQRERANFIQFNKTSFLCVKVLLIHLANESILLVVIKGNVDRDICFNNVTRCLWIKGIIQGPGVWRRGISWGLEGHSRVNSTLGTRLITVYLTNLT